MKPNPNEKERRFLPGTLEIRAQDGEDAAPLVRGYAAKFNVESDNLGTPDRPIREVILPGAFDDVLADDVRALFNHDPNMVLARSKNGEGTMRMGVDETGLWYEFPPPDTQAGRDLVENIRLGNVDQSSFAFTVEKAGQSWSEKKTDDGTSVMQRAISKIKRLFDVSPVTYPAYPDATVALRSLEDFQQADGASEDEPTAEDHSLAHWQRVMDLKDKTAAKNNN